MESGRRERRDKDPPLPVWEVSSVVRRVRGGGTEEEGSKESVWLGLEVGRSGPSNGASCKVASWGAGVGGSCWSGGGASIEWTIRNEWVWLEE